MLLRCNSILRYSFAVPYLASRNLALAFLCVSTLLLCDSQQCAAIPLRIISVLCISIALPHIAPLCHRKANHANLSRFNHNNFYYRTGNT
nr:MAG TPA: hypothetical protein [Caudoviricetes sp.]